MVDIIASHPDHDIIIGIDTLGKEDLLLHIARVLNIKVCVENCIRPVIIGFSCVFLFTLYTGIC